VLNSIYALSHYSLGLPDTLYLVTNPLTLVQFYVSGVYTVWSTLVEGQDRVTAVCSSSAKEDMLLGELCWCKAR